MKVYPVAGALIRDPVKRDLLPAEGRTVVPSVYWRRRIRDGDATLTAPVVVVAAPVVAAVAAVVESVATAETETDAATAEVSTAAESTAEADTASADDATTGAAE